jgi:putative membrane protein
VKRLMLLGTVAAPFACAHEGEPLKPHDLWRAWSFDSGIVIPLVLTAVVYSRGATAAHGVSLKRKAWIWAGWLVLCVALLSPLHPLGEALFSAHMAQHELLMVVAAPLLVLGRPLVALLWGLPFLWRRVLGQWSKPKTVQSTWRFFTHPMTAWWIHAAALWLWHIPRFFQATLDNDWIHSAQHLSFLGSALLFWWSLFYAHGKVRYGASVLYLFTAAVHTSILGALLTFSSTIWYPDYIATTTVWGLTPLEDQQAGGLIMWIPAGLVYVIGALLLFAEWLRESDRIANSRSHNGEREYAA